MDKQAGILNELASPVNKILNLYKAGQKDSAQYKSLMHRLKLATGATAGAVGGGALYTALSDTSRSVKNKELDKIRTSLALQELQSDTGTDTGVFGKTSSANKALRWALLGTVAGGGALIPAVLSARKLQEMEAAKKKQAVINDIKNLSTKYDQKFKSSVLEDMNVAPTALKSTVADMSKASSEKTAGNPWPLAVAALGTGAGIYSFAKGKEHGEENSANVQKMKAYREMLDRVTRLRNAPVVINDGPFSPEEMVALNKLRQETKKPKKKPALKQGGTEPSKVSAKADDPALQELLGSI